MDGRTQQAHKSVQAGDKRTAKREAYTQLDPHSAGAVVVYAGTGSMRDLRGLWRVGLEKLREDNSGVWINRVVVK